MKGLITEASFLTYPEDSSIDESNTVISRKGNRTRRLGIDYEDSHVMVDMDVVSDTVVNEFVWKAVAKQAGLNFLCIQIGTKIRFFSLEASPVSDSLKGFTVDLSTYKIANANVGDVDGNYAEFSSGQGLLFLVHPYVEPLCVEYDSDADTISVIRVVIQMRDFEGVHDGLANDEEPSTLSTEHQYNLLNQGWVTPGTSSASSGEGSTIGSSTYYDPYTGQEVEYRPGGLTGIGVLP